MERDSTHGVAVSGRVTRRTMLTSLAAALLAARRADAAVAALRMARSQVDAERTAAGIPGCCIGLIDDGRAPQFLSSGVRDSQTGQRVDEELIWEAASLTKPVFAVLVLQLVGSGVVDLDRPLREYLERPYVDDGSGDGLTARHVLTHTSGLPNWRRGKPLAFQSRPGDRYGYSGEAFVYLQHVVERVTGRELPQLLAERVLRPLGMSRTTLGWDARFGARTVSGHDKSGAPVARLDLRLQAFQSPGQADPEVATPNRNAAASLYTSVHDYMRFVKAVIDGPARLRLSPALYALMGTAVVPVQAGVARSVGWGIEDTAAGPVWFHGGNNFYVRHVVALSPGTRTAICCFTNGVSGPRLFGSALRLAFTSDDHPALNTL